MQYKIIVDKQPSSNPSSEKKEYVIDIEELRVKGDVYDSLNIELNRTYVTRRLSLSEYGVLSVLDEPVIEELTEVNIELFEGDNYIYLIDMQGNKFYAEYLIKNDFNDIYATKNEMNSAITQTAESIELSVNQKLTSYATTDDLEEQVTELNSTITQTAQEINLEVSKKVNDEELTGANITLRINEDTSEATIDADKISLEGKQINLTGDNINITSTNFSVDKNGNMSCNSAKLKDLTIDGGQINLTTEGKFVGQDVFKIVDGNDNYFRVNATRGWFHNANSNNTAIYFQNANTAAIILKNSDGDTTQIYGHRITTPELTQTSLENIKKNISKFTKNATDIIKNSDIYEYNLKSDEDTDKKMIGFVIGDNYKTPEEVIDKEGQAVELYSAIGILWKGFQEQQKNIEILEQRVEQLERRIQDE